MEIAKLTQKILNFSLDVGPVMPLELLRADAGDHWCIFSTRYQVVSLDTMIAATKRKEGAWNSAISFCKQVIFAKEMAEWNREVLRTLPVRQAYSVYRYRGSYAGGGHL